uniref:Uncharacterized protein n=1 Tax=Aplanochytrium stocchinoi TaxID=215587 RepID=A0A7S3PLI4_9STRA
MIDQLEIGRIATATAENINAWARVNRAYLYRNLLIKQSDTLTEADIFAREGWCKSEKYANLPSFESAERILNVYEQVKTNQDMSVSSHNGKDTTLLRVIGFEVENDKITLDKEKLLYLERLQSQLRKEYHSIYAELRYRLFSENVKRVTSTAKEQMTLSLRSTNDIEAGSSIRYFETESFRKDQSQALCTYISTYSNQISMQGFMLGLLNLWLKQLRCNKYPLSWTFPKATLAERGNQFCIDTIELLFLHMRFDLQYEDGETLSVIVDYQQSNPRIRSLIRMFPNKEKLTLASVGNISKCENLRRINIRGEMDRPLSTAELAKEFLLEWCVIL